jgi:hypothetical protein
VGLPGQAGQDRLAEDLREHGLAEGDRVRTVLPAGGRAALTGAQYLAGRDGAEVRENRLVEGLRGLAGRAGHDRGQPADVRPGLGGGTGCLLGREGPRPQFVRGGRVTSRGLFLVERLPVPGEVRSGGMAGDWVDGQQDVDHPGLHRLGLSHDVSSQDYRALSGGRYRQHGGSRNLARVVDVCTTAAVSS